MTPDGRANPSLSITAKQKPLGSLQRRAWNGVSSKSVGSGSLNRGAGGTYARTGCTTGPVAVDTGAVAIAKLAAGSTEVEEIAAALATEEEDDDDEEEEEVEVTVGL
jgi:hypothetical protein